jgi:hypothetical protein
MVKRMAAASCQAAWSKQPSQMDSSFSASIAPASPSSFHRAFLKRPMIVLVEAEGLASHQADMNNRPAFPVRDLDVIALSVFAGSGAGALRGE